MGSTYFITDLDFPLLKEGDYSTELCECGSGLRKSLERRRNNTQYHNDKENWLKPCCDSCFSESHNYYAELWTDWYKGCL